MSTVKIFLKKYRLILTVAHTGYVGHRLSSRGGTLLVAGHEASKNDVM